MPALPFRPCESHGKKVSSPGSRKIEKELELRQAIAEALAYKSRRAKRAQ
jgi:hypothetical protein